MSRLLRLLGDAGALVVCCVGGFVLVSGVLARRGYAPEVAWVEPLAADGGRPAIVVGLALVLLGFLGFFASATRNP